MAVMLGLIVARAVVIALKRLSGLLLALTAVDVARRKKAAPIQLLPDNTFAPSSTSKMTKIVYVIRHGESQWNVAQKRKDPLAMFGQFDHALTRKGVEQAEELRSRIRAAPRYSRQRLEFESAGEVLCSPLTRALQTALIALAAHPAMRADGVGVTLIPECRELCYPTAGFDSLRGTTGEEIASRAVRRARRVAKQKSLGPLERGAARVDASETEESWWGFEGRGGLTKRLTKFMSRLCASKHSTLIVVGHSLFFQAIFENFAAEDVKKKDAVIRLLSKKKLKNAQMARLVLDCSKPLRNAIVKADFAFEEEEAETEEEVSKPAAKAALAVPRGGATGSRRSPLRSSLSSLRHHRHLAPSLKAT